MDSIRTLPLILIFEEVKKMKNIDIIQIISHTYMDLNPPLRRKKVFLIQYLKKKSLTLRRDYATHSNTTLNYSD